MSQIRIPEASTAVPATDVATSGAGPLIADPGPLGLAAFAMTTFILNIFNTRILPISLEATVLPLALFYGGGAQLLAGMWEFRKGNTFGALAFTSFGAFWLSFYWYVHNVAGTLPAAQAHKATGIFLLAWAIFTLYMSVAAMRTTGAVLAVFVALELTFIFLCIGNFATGNTSIDLIKVGGWLGLITAALAWYASFAGVTNATWGRVVMPTFPLNGPVAVRRTRQAV